jgi:arylsulfatase A-like enzyme
MSKYHLLFFVIFVLLSACRRVVDSDSGQGPPNILLIMTDDQGWGDLSIHGNPILETPRLDSLARQSVRFDRFYVSPVCAPTRASLLTGRYHLRTGTSWVTHRREVMRSTEVTMAEYLKEAGYRTGIFGKWHNGAQYPNDPLGQGFDEFLGFCAGHWNNYFDTRLQHNRDTVQPEGYITDVLTDGAIEFIRTTSDQPFFCYVPYNAPHSPFQVPDEYFNKYSGMGLDDKNAAVFGMCKNIDDNVGRLLNTLEEQNIAGNTIVVFLTDNGPNGVRYNGGMKGKKADVDEGGVRVPCIIRWPGKLPKNRLVTQLAAHIDLLPTLMDLAGLPLDPVQPLDGRSLLPLMTQENPDWEDRAIFNVQTNGKLRLFPGAMRTPAYRFVIDRENQNHLYHMLQDPGQENDIAAENSERVDSMRTVYEKWFAEVTKAGIAPPPIPIGYPGEPTTELPAPEAQLNGSIEFKGRMGWANDYIINWASPADSAVWEVFPAEAGNYEVLADYTAAEPAVGAALQVRVRENRVRAVIPEAYDPKTLPSPDRVLRGEVYEKVWKRMSLGTLPIQKGRRSVILTIDRELPAAALEIKALWLRKQTVQ